MTSQSSTASARARKSLRLWPGVLLASVQAFLWWVLPVVNPAAMGYAIIGGLLAGAAIFLWWTLLSRAPVMERLGAILLLILVLFATPSILHKSIATGMMGMMFYLYAIPVLSVALVIWAVAGRNLSGSSRKISLVVTMLGVSALFGLIRTGGITGDADSDFHWRWSETPEERLLARKPPKPAVPLSVEAGEVLWPGFRGPHRDGVLPGVRIATDWKTSPPLELWRRSIGPGWSSFAVAGDLIYTQEQRGEEELVSCYSASTGQPVWQHRDTARFWESNGGAGPRATPTLAGDRVYTLGATGILNVLNALEGSPLWSRNVVQDASVKIPAWGIAGSPLIVDDRVIVAAAGRLAAYNADTGNLLWLGPTGGWGYSSPQLTSIDGVAQVLLLNGAGVISVRAEDGKELWSHTWHGDGIVQPEITPDGDVMLGTGSGLGDDAGMGVRRLTVSYKSGAWTPSERWTSTGLKPYFNDFVVHQGHGYGFDGSLLACIDLTDGQRCWKGGRYGHGQLILLPDQDLLLVLSEQGEIALVAASPEGYRELAKVPAIQGKTWNHPVLARDLLLVRNGEQMVAFRLAPPG